MRRRGAYASCPGAAALGTLDSPIVRERRWLHTSAIAALVCAVAIACSFALEAGFRVWRGIPLSGDLRTENDGTDRVATFRKSSNEILIYEPIPLARTRYTGVETVINSTGLRDREVSRAKPTGTTRLVVLGDSVVWGYGVEFPDTFARQLERLLKSDTTSPVEVLSFAVPGYNTRQEIELYRTRAAGFDPDLVVVGYNLNDEIESSLEVELFEQAYFPIHRHSYAFDFVRFAWQELRDRREVAEEVESGTDRIRQVDRDFAELREAVGEHVPILVVVFPFLVEFANYPHLHRHRRIDRAAGAAGLRSLDLLAHFRGQRAATLRVFADDREHPNPLGLRIAAEATARFLRDRHLISDGS